jgi:hypothetical protein
MTQFLIFSWPAVFAISVAMAAEDDDSMIDTWKLNTAESTIPAGAPPPVVILHAIPVGDNDLKVVAVDPDGRECRHGYSPFWMGTMTPIAHTFLFSRRNSSLCSERRHCRSLLPAVRYNQPRVKSKI